MKERWNTLATIGPEFGYFPNAKKSWIIVKPEKEETAKDLFEATAINVTSEGHKHLGVVIDSPEYLREYVDEKVTDWVSEIVKLAKIAITEPQACYSAYTFSLKHRWTYFLRTIPNTHNLLETLEKAINHVLIPALTGHKCNQLERDILSLPVRLGGLGLGNPQLEAARECASSVEATASLVEQIKTQQHQLSEDAAVKPSQRTSRLRREEDIKDRVKSVYEMASNKTKRALDLDAEKGSSVWLIVISVQELGFNLNKREFRDAIKLRYDWSIEDTPSTSVCGDIFTVDHALICRKGGFIIQRHNELRYLEAELLGIVSKDVEVEPQLQDVSGEQLNRGSNMARDARLDIHAHGFWELNRSAFFDTRVCHPNADSYRNLEPRQIYRIHETEKKRLHSRRVLDIEHGTFTPLVFASTGGMGKESLRYHSRLAELISTKKGEHYSKTISWIRARTSFALLRSALICLRGSRTID